jgi:hypothetical protein
MLKTDVKVKRGTAKRFVAVLTAAFCAVLVFGCKPAPETPAPGTAAVWSASSSVKILRDRTYTDRGPAALTVRMAKNEYESQQLILTADAKISGYDLTVRALSDGNGHEIPAAAVEVFNEWYMQAFEGYASNKETTLFGPGWYPDALVPFAAARAHGDTKIEKGDNQGLWVKFKTEKTTAAGTYTGSFTLTVDGVNREIPVSVTVWDFTVPDEVNTQSAFLLYCNDLSNTEGDSGLAMRKAYFDYFLDYRLSLMNLPVDTNPDNVVEVLREYARNPKLSAYNIPYESPTGNVDIDALSRMVKRIVAASVEDGVDYLEKAYIYNMHTDEYTGNLGETKTIRAIQWMKAFTDMKADLEVYFDAEFGAAYLDGVPGMRRSLKVLTDLQVTGGVHYNIIADERDATHVTLDDFNAIVNGFHGFITQEDREKQRAELTGDGEELWWYGGVLPQYPYPNYHVDDSALSARLVSWMQYDYNIDGVLYWSVDTYHQESNHDYIFYPLDEWETSGRNHGNGVQGDGFIVYPGQRYGITGPIGTIRLEMIRDGLEEYEYLKLLDDECFAPLRVAYNAPDMTVSMFARSVLDTVYSGVIPTIDTATAETARMMLADTIAWAKEGVAAGSPVWNRDTATADVYLPAGAVLKTDSLPAGTTLVGTQGAGTGTKYSFSLQRIDRQAMSLSLDFTQDGTTKHFERFISAAWYAILAFGNEDAQAYVSVPANKGEISRTVAPDLTPVHSFALDSAATAQEALLYEPYFTLKNNLLPMLAGYSRAVIEFYNPESFDIRISLQRRTSLMTVEDTSVTLKAGEWTSLELPLASIADVTSYRVVLPNRFVGGVPQTQTVYVSYMYGIV